MHSTSTLFFAALVISAGLSAQRMIAVDSSRAVSEVDIATGGKTPLGTISSNASTTAGFAYDAVAGRLYLTSTGNDSVYLVDMTNWQARLIGNYGVGSSVVMHGIEWDPSTGTLYASGNAGDFYSVNTTTGQATSIGPTGLTSFQNLGYDPSTNVLYITSSGSDSLYTIDRATGATTLVGPLVNSTNPNSLAYDIDNLTMYMADNSTDNLYTLDLTTGTANIVGSMGSGNILGLAYIPGTGRLTRAAHGCGPTTIFVTGNPNIGGTVEFTVGNTTGVPLVGFGQTALGVPFCGCTIGHEWAVALVGANASFTIPPNPVFVGANVYAQGVDFLGAGGCPDPLLTLTDTITIAVGS